MAWADILQKGYNLTNTFLDFDLSETPPWGYGVTGVQDMIGEIVHLKRQYPENSLNKETVRNFRDDFIFQMSHDEGVGIQDKEKMLAVTREEDIPEPFRIVDGNIMNTPTDGKVLVNKITNKEHLETKNMLKAWKYFETLRQSTNDSVLSVDLVLEGHRILMKGLKNPGQFSEHGRYTICPMLDEEVDYPTPSFVALVCPTLLDYANYIACYLREILNKDGPTEDIVSQIVKFCACFFASFVQLHPFSDGNGRMSRLLYFYIQSVLSPFAVGVYNINAPTEKMDYLKAICIVREENKKYLENEENEFRQNNWRFASKPRDLARMILECQWHAWRHFDDKQKQKHSYKRQLTTELLTPESLEDYYNS